MKKKYQFMMVLCCFFQLLHTSFALADTIPPSDPSSVPMHPRPADWKVIFNRVVSLFHHDGESSEHSSKKMKGLARAVSSFQPSCVLGLLPVSDEATLSMEQVDTFCFLRKEIASTNPHCKFEATLNLTRYPTASALLSKLQEISLKIAPDIFLLVVPKNNEVVYPSVLAKGIEYIHEHGQVVGYEGPTSMIPDGIDFLMICAENGIIHREEIASLRMKHRLPILVRVNKSFWHESSTSSEQHTTEVEQAKLLIHLAEEQNAFGYHFVYPVLSALAMRQHDFHDAAESSLLVRMRALMMRFN
ncbi:MAG: hypothetical protein DVB29_06085 [Verrucomicrobia bacterium]|nr:MAG: hypothetical protein DVB29_06085 [Verrucomicrobiota bacterium]